MSTISTLTTNWHLRAQEASYFISHSILVDDHLATLGMEVQLIWGKTFGLVSYLFIFNRYFPLAAWASFAFPVPLPDSCRYLSMELVAATGISVAVAEAMLIIKVYAINHRKRWVLFVLLLVWLGQFGSMAYSVSGSNIIATDTSPDETAVAARKWRCNLNTSAASHFQLGFILPLVIFDCTAFTLTFLGLSRYSTPGESMLIGVAPLLPRTSISAHVLRDGLFYFLILCVVNISWAISSSFLDPDFQNIVHLPSSALTVILMNRMILHTRSYLERTQANDFRTSRTSRPVSLPEFAIGIHSPSYSHGQITISTNSTLRD